MMGDKKVLHVVIVQRSGKIKKFETPLDAPKMEGLDLEGGLVERTNESEGAGSGKGLKPASQATMVLGMLTKDEQTAYAAIVKKGMKGAGKEAEALFVKGIRRAAGQADLDPDEQEKFIRGKLKESYVGEDPFGVLQEWAR